MLTWTLPFALGFPVPMKLPRTPPCPATCVSLPFSLVVHCSHVPSSVAWVVQALRQHRDAALEGQGEAHDAVLASLQCMQALTSGGGGMDAAIAAPDFLACLCSVLDPDDQDCSKLVVEMLTKLCLYSVEGYCAAMQVGVCNSVLMRSIVSEKSARFCL